MEVLSIRVPKKLKEALKKADFDWRSFLIESLEKKISELETERILAELDSMNKDIRKKPCSPSYELIREDREK